MIVIKCYLSEDAVDNCDVYLLTPIRERQDPIGLIVHIQHFVPQFTAYDNQRCGGDVEVARRRGRRDTPSLLGTLYYDLCFHSIMFIELFSYIILRLYCYSVDHCTVS